MIIRLLLIGGGATYLYQRNKRNIKKTVLPNFSRNKHNTKKTVSPNFNGKKLLQDFKTAILGDERQQQQLTLDPEMQADIKKYEKEANRHLLLSVGATGLAVLASVYPTLSILGTGAVLYLARDVFYFIWRDFKKGYFLSVYLFDVIMLIGMIATGHLVLAAFSGVISDFLMKIVKKAEENSEKQIINVFSGHPPHVWIEKEGIEIQVDFNTLQKGDHVIVNAGEIIPVDGVIHSGLANIDQHIMTGKSQSVERAMGDKVFASTLLLSGRITILVETAGEETVAAGIGQVLNKTQNYKDNLIARGQKIADSFLPIELGSTAVTLAILGPTSALAVMWSNLGANMAVLDPLSVLNYLQILSRYGILLKDGRMLESLRQVDTVVFDKTGTLTLEQPTVGKIHCLGDYDENTLLGYAAAAEYRQLHPIAKAIVDKAISRNLELPDLEEASYEMGYGIKVLIDGQLIRVGSGRFMNREGIELPEVAQNIQAPAEEEGFSLLYVGINQQLGGLLEMHPGIRPEAVEIIQHLKKRGMKLYIISGDHEHPTQRMAETLGIDNYFAEILPENKAKLVKQLCEEGRFVCFIGDGINDAIALKSAQVSISLKGASTTATDTAKIIFMDGTLNHLEQLFQLADEFENTMRANLLSTIVPGVICISGVYLLHFGIAMGMGLYYVGSVVGLSNTLWPLVKHQEDKSNQDLRGD
jgi:heavy metal translocating P-type ATPase